jgi:two-component system, sensor histidine kinase
MPVATPLSPNAAEEMERLALETQAALAPYALLAFVGGASVVVWAGTLSAQPGLLALVLVAFTAACGVSYAAVSWLRSPAARTIAGRCRAHLSMGLAWAGAVAAIAAFAAAAGPAREPLAFIALAAAIVCTFFTAPWLPSLLIVAPAAALGPIFVLHAGPNGGSSGHLGLGAIALTLALCMVMNRLLRRQYMLAVEREALITDRARKMDEAGRLARSKSDLIATLSHEIRNGLSGVAHVLAAATGASGRAAPSREQLSAALDAARDLISVLDTTLDAETAEAGRLSVNVAPVDVIALTHDLIILNRPNAAAKGLQLSLHIPPELADASQGAALGDAVRVRQILANLVGNAVKFTVRGRVEARLELVAPDRLAISVVDTGPGLDHMELEQAFEPFHRIARTSAGTTGAGLGLSLSRRLAALMDGALTADSAVGVGSCFRLELPFDSQATAERAPSSDTEVAAPHADGRRLRVLIAEDDSLNAAMLRAVLEQLGHHVVHAHDGRRAVELAQMCEFDLMMIDGRMPELDGPQTITAVRRLPAPHGRPPIVAVIGGDSEDAQLCTDAGADAVLRKPVSVSAVARAVTAAADGRSDLASRAA